VHTILLFYFPYFVSILVLILILGTTAAAVDNGSSDTCGLPANSAGLALSKTTFNCANVGDTTVTLTVTDVNANTATCSEDVTVQVCVCLTLYVCVFPCCIWVCLTLYVCVCPCSMGVPHAVCLCVSVLYGCASRCMFVCVRALCVQDITPPIPKCSAITLQLDANGAAST
jgi:hypothetical protein